MATSLHDEQIRQYREQGFLAPLSAFDARTAAGYRAQLESAEARFGDRVARDWKHKPHLVMTWADELIRHPAILDAVEGIIGPDILCWESSLFDKPASSSSFISWHQDITYWGLSADEVVTAWVALSPSTPQSGCMQVVGGTHKMDVVAHRDTFAEDNMLSRGQEIEVEVNADEVDDVVLQPGEFSLHHVKLFHGSNPNGSTDRRLGFVARYLPPHLQQVVGSRDSAMLVRGRCNSHDWELEHAPETDFAPEAIEYQARIKAQRMEILMPQTG